MDMCVLFFFQAEDGIRDLTVTGVQTCALPISHPHLAMGHRGIHEERETRLPGVARGLLAGGRRATRRRRLGQERRAGQARSPGHAATGARPRDGPVRPPPAWRSEEHTSELQSQSNLVCRLLLEKKNTV